MRHRLAPLVTPLRPPQAFVRPAAPQLADRRESLAALALLAAVVAIVAAAFWPGLLNPDSIYMIEQIATKQINDHHTPLLQYLWSPFWHQGVGPGWVLVLQLSAFALGAYLVLRLAFAPLTAALATSALALLPTTLGTIALVSRDMWFLAALLLGFGLVAAAARRSGRARSWLLVGAVVAAWTALAARQNAAPTATIVLVLVAGMLLRARWRARGGWPSWQRQALAAGVVGAVACVGLLGSQLLATQLLPIGTHHPAAYTQLYDLAAISERERRNLIPAEVLPDRSVEVVDERYRVDGVGEWIYAADAPIAGEFTAETAAAMGRAHRSALRTYPLTYLDARIDLLGAQLAISEPRHLYWPGIEANRFGYRVENPSLYEGVKSYLDWAAGRDKTDLFPYRIWLYLVAATIAGVVLLRRRDPRMLIGVGIALVPLLHQIGLVLLAPSAHFRYELAAVVFGMLAPLLAIGLRLRHGGDPAAAATAAARANGAGGVSATPRPGVAEARCAPR